MLWETGEGYIPPEDSLIWCDEDTAKLLRSAGAAKVVVGRRAKPDERRKSLDAMIECDVVLCGW